MADYFVRGTKTLMSYFKTLGLDMNAARQRAAASINVPIIYFRSDGQDPATFSRKITNDQAEALAAVMGVSVANLVTNGGLVQLP